jgi:pSer/pThr/pTyr-binding forkhead associated (FHA) protein
MEARITVISGSLAGQSFKIPPGNFIIGRERDWQLAVDSPLVSRHHSVLLRDDSTCTLRVRDLGSTSGTFVNLVPARRDERILLHGDTLRVGGLILRGPKLIR